MDEASQETPSRSQAPAGAAAGNGAAAAAGDGKLTYKSWKKKYIKMRIVFDQKRDELEKLHQKEVKARTMAKKLAVQNDRILDMLLEINNSPQIPAERRVDVALDPPSKPSDPALPMDRAEGERRHLSVPPAKSLRQLLRDVPHLSYQQARERAPELVEDLEPFENETYPPSILTPDDIDDYLYEVDRRLGLDPGDMVPTMSPAAARDQATAANGGVPLQQPPAAWDVTVKNLTGGYSWLRKYAPKTFLQDGEAGGASTAAAAHQHDDDDAESHHPPQRGSRKSRGGGRSGGGERGGRSGGGGTRAKRASASHRAAAAAAAAAAADSWDASMDDDPDFTAAAAAATTTTTTPAARGGKRKRAAADDDDRGYRPKGGSSSRPTKKKRRSEGGDVATPTGGPKRSKKVVED